MRRWFIRWMKTWPMWQRKAFVYTLWALFLLPVQTACLGLIGLACVLLYFIGEGDTARDIWNSI